MHIFAYQLVAGHEQQNKSLSINNSTCKLAADSRIKLNSMMSFPPRPSHAPTLERSDLHSAPFKARFHKQLQVFIVYRLRGCYTVQFFLRLAMQLYS